MHALCAQPDGTLEVVDARPLARSGTRLIPLKRAQVIPLPEAATLMHLPGRTAWARSPAGPPMQVPGLVPVAAVLPVGYLRTLLPASQPLPGAARLPLFGYAAVLEHGGEVFAAALHTDAFDWWQPASHGAADLPTALQAAREALPGNRIVEQLATCALEHRCYTAQNTLRRQYEGALPASPACNADCLGCISLQPEPVPTPQPRMGYAPTVDELVDLAGYHLGGGDAHIVSFGQGCEGEPLTRGETLVRATERIRRAHPGATVHVNTNGSRPRTLQRMIDAGCTSVRISAISFDDAIFRPYYRPVGYSLDDVLECGRVMSRAGGQVCLNLLTFPGITDVPAEMARTTAACREMGVHQVQWRSLNVDHDWLVEVLPRLDDGTGLEEALHAVSRALPGVQHGNFTRPWPVAVPSH